MVKPQVHAAVVDDDPSVREALARVLKLSGIRVESFPSGPAFLRSLAEVVPDCVLLDLRMPGMGGLDVMQELIERRLPIKSIVLTGTDDPETVKACAAAGAFAVLAKPIDEESLLNVVAQAVGHRRSLLG
jgi:FixJ family two-component response regulator